LVQLGRALCEVALLGLAGGHSRRLQVGLAGLGGAAGAFEQVRADGFHAVGVLHAVVGLEGAEQREPGPRAVHHGQRDRAAEVTTGPGAIWASTS
jgi:hypothetical protein